MHKKQSGILNEIDVLITRGNYNKALKSINKHITKDTQEVFFYLELLLRKSRLHFYNAEYSTSLTLASKSQKLSKKINNSLLIIDSLQIQGEVYSELGQNNELYSVMIQIEEQLEIKQDKKGVAYQKRKAEYYKLSGLYQIQKSELHKAIAEFQKSLDIFKQIDIQERIAEVSSKLGYLFFIKGDKEKESIIFDAIKIQKKLGNKEALSRSYIVLAENSLRRNELKQAVSNLEIVFRLLENSENKYLLGQANNLRGLVYYEKGEFSLALKFLNKSLDFFKIIDNKRLIGSLISNMGLIHNLRGDLDLSLASFDQSLLIFEELGIQQNIAYHLGKLGSVYGRKGEHDLALVYFYKALEIMKQLNVEVSIAKILSNIISVSICNNDLENAQQYLKQLQDINKSSSNKKINNWTRISEALVLKSQKNDQDIERGFAILKQIAEEEIINIENYGDVFLNLCDILLKKLQTKGQEEYLIEIRKYLNQLYEMAHKQDSFWLVAQANWLLAYLAVIELDMIKAQHMFTQAQQMAEERGFKRLAMNISNEFDKMLKKSSDFDSLTKKDLSLVDRVERSGFEAIIKKIKQDIVDDEDLRDEKPVMLCIFNSKGHPIFHQTFLQDKLQLNDVLVDEFKSAVKNLLVEISHEEKPIHRILYRELLVILKSFDDLSFCYVFDGQSYAAIERLETIITSLQKQSPTLWNKILVQCEKGESIDTLTEQDLMRFVNDLFTTTYQQRIRII